MYIVKNNNGSIIYEGDNALQAKYVCAGFPEYDLYDENGTKLNKEEVFASIKRNRSSRRAKKEETENVSVPVNGTKTSEATSEPKKETSSMKILSGSNATLIDHDAIIRTEASDNAPAIKNSMVHPDEKRYLKHKGDTVIAVIKKDTAIPYIEKVGSYYKIKSGYIK